MLNLKDISIRRKQTLIIMLTSAVALLLACAAFLTYDALSFRAEMVRNASTTAEIIGNNCAAALDFNDPKAAGETLASLNGEPNIIYACIYDRDRKLFASYQRDGTNAVARVARVKPAGQVFTGEELLLFKPIIVRGETLGTIYLAHDLRELNHRMTSYIGIAALVLGLSLLVAFLLSSRLQRLISGPILQLAKVTRRVAAEKNYSLRAVKSGGGELGDLVDGFNEMLVEIQARDLELQNARDTLERRVVERTARLEESVSVANAILESTTDGILAVDLWGHVISYNSKFAATWNIPAEIIARGNYFEMATYCADLVSDRAKFLAMTERVRKSPETASFEVVELKDGRVFERHALPQRMKNEVVGMVINWHDITERQRADAAVRQTQALYHSLVDQIPAGIYRKDAEGRYVFVNRWFCTTFGVTPEDCLGKTPMEVATNELTNPNKAYLKADPRKQEAQGAVDQHALIIQSGKTIELEEKHVRADGSVQYLQVVKTPVFDSTGEIIGTQGIQFEVTQQKQAQIELAYERDLLRALMDNAPDHIYFKDAESRFIKSSQAQAVQFGVASSDELVGKTDFDFFSEEHARPAFEAEQEIIRTGKPLIGMVEREIWKDGRKESWVLTTKMPFRNKDGKIIGTFGVSKDITMLKDAEAKLEQVHKDLLTASRQAGMAEVASNVLHNVGNVLNSVNVSATLAADIARKSKVSSLAKVVDLLDQHAQDLGEFLARDAKGKQIPGYLRRLCDHLAQEQQTSVTELESLRKNIEHIKDIVSMQQNYAKMSGLKEMVNVADLVDDSLRMNAGALQRHEVVLTKEFEPVPVINVEKHKVLQILVNLIRNAKYACDEGSPKEKRLTVRIAKADELIKISVADNGIGIPAENLMRIFNHGFTTRKTGHGFGLHSGALAAKEMGGRLVVRSDGVGHGATFTLELPIKREKEQL